MAQTYSTEATGTLVQARAGDDITSQTKSFVIPTGFVTSDIIPMIKIPVNATVLEVILTSSASVGATSNLTVGDGGLATRYITSTAFTSSVTARLNNHLGHGYKYTVEDTIDVFALSIATPIPGTVITLTAIYTLQTV